MSKCTYCGEEIGSDLVCSNCGLVKIGDDFINNEISVDPNLSDPTVKQNLREESSSKYAFDIKVEIIEIVKDFMSDKSDFLIFHFTKGADQFIDLGLSFFISIECDVSETTHINVVLTHLGLYKIYSNNEIIWENNEAEGAYSEPRNPVPENIEAAKKELEDNKVKYQQQLEEKERREREQRAEQEKREREQRAEQEKREREQRAEQEKREREQRKEQARLQRKQLAEQKRFERENSRQYRLQQSSFKRGQIRYRATSVIRVFCIILSIFFLVQSLVYVGTYAVFGIILCIPSAVMMLIISARRLYSETIYCISFTFFSVGYVLHVVFELMSVFNNLGTLNSGKNFDFSVLSELQQQARCDKYFIVSFLLVALLVLFFVRNASKSSRTKMILTIIIEVGLIAVAIAMFVTVQNSPLEVIANRTLGKETSAIVRGLKMFDFVFLHSYIFGFILVPFIISNPVYDYDKSN